ncbi:MAG: DUF5320 domain-containing protein [Desulfobulbaceae bacterium]|nr:DUF5320 domain-containing protein [Desulfobulbaceae bacterium]
MPRFNQSGPSGQGPMTGRQRGVCARTDYDFFNAFGSGQGQGRRRGREMGQRVAPPVTPFRIRQRMGVVGTESTVSGDELDSLKEQYESAVKRIERMQDEIEAIKAQQK